MSVHGVCFDNGMAGKCGYACQQFIDGDCGIGDEIVEQMVNDASPEELEEALVEHIEPVKLFTLRGAGLTDLEILTKAIGY